MRDFKEINGIQYMKCSKCKKWFPESTEYFPKHRAYKNGLDSRCRPCHSKKSREWKKKHRKQCSKLNSEWNKKHRAQCNKLTRDWRKRNPIQNKILQAKTYAKERNLGFNLIAPIPFPKEDRKDWCFHHINENDIVAVPRDIHALYGNKEHKFMLLQIVKQLYPYIGEIKKSE